MNYESKLLRLHGEVITVTSSELTRKGEPKSNGEPSKIDYARIRFEWNGGSYKDMISFENATHIHNIVAIAGVLLWMLTMVVVVRPLYSNPWNPGPDAT